MTTRERTSGEAISHVFIREVMDVVPGDSRLQMCIQCGTCGGSCPSAADMDHTPRQLFAMVRAGQREKVLHSNTPWMCVSCYYCSVRCPQEVHIPDVMYGLKSIAGREERPAGMTASSFSRTFMANVRRFGRSYEMGLVAQHYIRHFPMRLPGMTGAGMSMLASGRMGIKPHKIRAIKGLRAIMDRAEELEQLP